MPDLESFPLIKSVLLYYAGAACAFALFLGILTFCRWRKGEPIRRYGDLRAMAEDLCNLMWLSSLLASPAIWERIWDRTGWGEVAVVLAMTGLLMLISGHLASQRVAEFQAKARLNTNAELDAKSPPPVPIDWNMEARLAALLIPALIIYLCTLFLIIWTTKSAALPSFTVALLAMAWLVAVPLAVVIARWPGHIRQRHTLVIKAAPQLVWDTLHCRETTHYYRPLVSRIEKVAGADNRFIWHYDDIGPCPLCGLPRAGETTTAPSRQIVEVTEQVPGRSVHLVSTFPPETPFHSHICIAERNACSIVPHADGAEVTYETAVLGARLWMAALILNGNVPKDLLEDLKSYLEGTPSQGVFGNARKHREHAEASPQLCGCT